MRLSRSPQTSSTSAPAASARSRSAAPWMSETTLMRMAAPSGGSGAGAGAGAALRDGETWCLTMLRHDLHGRPALRSDRQPGSQTGGWRAAAGRARGGDLRLRVPGVAGALPPARAGALGVARRLRAGLRGGRARRHLLPAARARGGRLLGGGAAGSGVLDAVEAVRVEQLDRKVRPAGERELRGGLADHRRELEPVP